MRVGSRCEVRNGECGIGNPECGSPGEPSAAVHRHLLLSARPKARDASDPPARCLAARCLFPMIIELLLLTRPVAATKTGKPKSQYRNPKQIRNPNLKSKTSSAGKAVAGGPPADSHQQHAIASSVFPSSLLPFLPSSLPPFFPLFCASNFGFCSKHAHTVPASYTRKLYSSSYHATAQPSGPSPLP